MKTNDSIAYSLQHVAGTLQRQTDQAMQERLGIGTSQYRILAMLAEQPNAEQRRIAESLGQTEASISRQVKLLHERGLIAVDVDPAERRKHRTSLTPKAHKLLVAAEDMLAGYYEPMLAGLSEKQRTQLREALHLLHEYTCAPGKPMACDHLDGIEGIYRSHEQATQAK